jgi:hypothetical protein
LIYNYIGLWNDRDAEEETSSIDLYYNNNNCNDNDNDKNIMIIDSVDHRDSKVINADMISMTDYSNQRLSDHTLVDERTLNESSSSQVIKLINGNISDRYNSNNINNNSNNSKIIIINNNNIYQQQPTSYLHLFDQVFHSEFLRKERNLQILINYLSSMILDEEIGITIIEQLYFECELYDTTEEIYNNEIYHECRNIVISEYREEVHSIDIYNYIYNEIIIEIINNEISLEKERILHIQLMYALLDDVILLESYSVAKNIYLIEIQSEEVFNNLFIDVLRDFTIQLIIIEKENNVWLRIMNEIKGSVLVNHTNSNNNNDSLINIGQYNNINDNIETTQSVINNIENDVNSIIQSILTYPSSSIAIGMNYNDNNYLTSNASFLEQQSSTSDSINNINYTPPPFNLPSSINQPNNNTILQPTTTTITASTTTTTVATIHSLLSNVYQPYVTTTSTTSLDSNHEQKHLVLLANQMLTILRGIILTRYQRGISLQEIYHHLDREDKHYFDANDLLMLTIDLKIETSNRVANIAINLIAIDGYDKVSFGEFKVFVLDSDHKLLEMNIQEQIAQFYSKNGKEYPTLIINIFLNENQFIENNDHNDNDSHSFLLYNEHYDDDNNYDTTQLFIPRNIFIQCLQKIGLILNSTEESRIADRFDIHGNDMCCISRFIHMIQNSRAWKHADHVIALYQEAIDESVYLRKQLQRGRTIINNIDLPQISEELISMCEYLGIRVLSENDMIWIAADALKAPLPISWTAQKDSNGRIFYYNHLTNQSKLEHPLDPHFRKLRDKYRQSHFRRSLLPVLQDSHDNHNFLSSSPIQFKDKNRSNKSYDKNSVDSHKILSSQYNADFQEVGKQEQQQRFKKRPQTAAGTVNHQNKNIVVDNDKQIFVTTVNHNPLSSSRLKLKSASDFASHDTAAAFMDSKPTTLNTSLTSTTHRPTTAPQSTHSYQNTSTSTTNNSFISASNNNMNNSNIIYKNNSSSSTSPLHQLDKSTPMKSSVEAIYTTGDTSLSHYGVPALRPRTSSHVTTKLSAVDRALNINKLFGETTYLSSPTIRNKGKNRFIQEKPIMSQTTTISSSLSPSSLLIRPSTSINRSMTPYEGGAEISFKSLHRPSTSKLNKTLKPIMNKNSISSSSLLSRKLKATSPKRSFRALNYNLQIDSIEKQAKLYDMFEGNIIEKLDHALNRRKL